MKKLAILFAVIFGITFTMSAQEDDESGQWFGSKRSVGVENVYNAFDFGEITSSIVSHEFVIRNTSPTNLTIKSIDVPEGVTVTILNKNIPPREQGKVIVTINRQYFKQKGEFALPIKIVTEQQVGAGVKNTKETIYLIKGKIM